MNATQETSHGHRGGGPLPAALSIGEAARELGVSRGTVYRRLNDGTIRGFRLGPTTRITCDEIRRIRDGQEVPA